MIKTYAGIGARDTPDNILKLFTYYAETMASRNHLLRTGCAVGADQAFIQGASKHSDQSEVYLPWKSYELDFQAKHPANYIYNHNKNQLFELAQTFHPAWDKCSYGAKLLHARNVLIMLGSYLEEPVDFVICYTKRGKPTGGTGQAIRIADFYSIPVYNVGVFDGSKNQQDEIINYLKQYLY